MVNQQKIWKRNCSSCGAEVSYKRYSSWWRANASNRICLACAKTKRKETQFHCGHTVRLTEDSLKLLRQSLKATYSQKSVRTKVSVAVKKAMHRPETRKKHIEGLHRSKWLKVRTDVGQIELLNKWNSLGFVFETNYQLKGEDFLYYVDGYDPIHNVVLEYDSEYHYRRPSIKEKDEIRQENIINVLKPSKFWRYNSVFKTWKNVIE